MLSLRLLVPALQFRALRVGRPCVLACRACPGQCRLGAREVPLRGLQGALGLPQQCCEILRLHPGDHLAGGDRVAFPDLHREELAADLGADVHLRRLDEAAAIDPLNRPGRRPKNGIGGIEEGDRGRRRHPPKDPLFHLPRLLARVLNPCR